MGMAHQMQTGMKIRTSHRIDSKAIPTAVEYQKPSMAIKVL